MNKKTLCAVIALIAVAGLSGACSSGSAPSVATNTANTAKPSENNATANVPKAEDETPPAVKAVFTDAQSFTTQHKDVPTEKVASIEKDTGGKVPAKDHHSYLAFATKDGKRTQIGAATVIKADGKEFIVIYESKNGMPTIKEVRGDGVAPEFLTQFAGKNHDAKIKFGEDIKANGANEATAKLITQAVRVDVLTMEALYGSAHSH